MHSPEVQADHPFQLHQGLLGGGREGGREGGGREHECAPSNVKGLLNWQNRNKFI